MEIIFKFYSTCALSMTKIKDGINHIEEVSNEILCFTINPKGVPVSMASRLDFIKEKMITPHRKHIPLITTANAEEAITLSGNFLSKNFNGTGTPMWYITLQVRKKLPVQKIEMLFSKLTETFNSYWAKLSNGEAEGMFFDQSQPDYMPKSNSDLPRVYFPEVYDSPYIPAKLGWINYWPAPTLKRIGFKEQHRALFYNVKDAANNGLILQITKGSLDFDIAEHLRKTVAIYDALPAIGGRDCV